MILRALDARTGDELHELVFGAPILAGPIASGNTLFVATYDGIVRALTHPADLHPLPPHRAE